MSLCATKKFPDRNLLTQYKATRRKDCNLFLLLLCSKVRQPRGSCGLDHNLLSRRNRSNQTKSHQRYLVHQHQKMSSPNSERTGNNKKSKNTIIIKTAAPVSFLLLIFQGFMGIKFSCPCLRWWNQSLAIPILIVPALFGGIMLSLFLKFEEQQNRGSGGFQTDSNRSKSETYLYYMIQCIPPLLWACIYFIDGDYVACLMTDWNGVYTCDTQIHPNCLSWCKPESNKGINGTEKYHFTQLGNNISKIIGYSLAFIFCILLLVIMWMTKDKNCPESGTPVHPRAQVTHSLIENDAL